MFFIYFENVELFLRNLISISNKELKKLNLDF